MKKTYRQFFISALSLTALLFASCDKADYTNDSTIEVAQDVKGTIAFVAPLQATQTVNEKNAGKYEYTVNLSEVQPVDVHLTVKLKSAKNPFSSLVSRSSFLFKILAGIFVLCLSQ